MDAQPFAFYNQNIPELDLSKGILLYRFQDIKYGQIKLHAYDHYQLMFIVNGSVFIETEDGELPARPGAFMLCPPDILHSTKIPQTTRDYHRYVIHVDNDVFMSALKVFGLDKDTYPYLGPDLQLYQFDAGDISDVLSYIDALYGHITNNDEFSERGVINVLGEILLHVERDRRKSRESDDSKNRSAAILAREIIEKDYRDSMLSLDSIANQLYLNKSYVARIYRETYDMTIYQSIIDLRLLHSLDQLESGKPVKYAYLEAGFKDYSAYLKAFKKKYDVLPSEYMNQLEAGRNPSS